MSASGATGMALGLGTGIKESIVSANVVVGNGSTGIQINGAQGKRIIVTANVTVGNGHTDQYGSGIVWVDAQEVTLLGNISLDNGTSPRPQMIAYGADPIYIANRVAPLGVPPASRIVRDTDTFAQFWRMYGSDTDLYVENQRTGKTYRVPIEVQMA